MNRPRRVAFLSEHASPVALLGGEDAGGQNVYVDEVTRHLAELGYHVDIFTRSGDPDEPDIVDWAPGVRVVNVRVGPPTFLLKDDLWPLMPAFRDEILRFMRETETRYDVIHGNFWMSGWVAAELKRELDIPAVQIFHALGTTKRRHQGDADTSPEERIDVEREVICTVDQVIAQCPSEVEKLIEEYEADPDRLTVIPSAVNVERFRPVPKAAARRYIGLDSDGFVVVYVGRMVRRKDVRNVVRAVALLAQQHGRRNGQTDTDITFLIVGGESADPDPEITPEIGALQRLGEDLGIIDRLHFAGCKPPEELRYYYSAGDVAVSTPWYEPFGLTPLEAMACGRPVIGAAVGGITYTVQDGETGFLVPPKDPEALARRLAQFMQNPDLGRTMGQAARERVEREFTWPTVARRTSTLYRRLQEPSPRRRTAELAADDPPIPLPALRPSRGGSRGSG